MMAAKTRMRSAFGQGGFLASVGALAALTASIVAFSGDVALAQNAGECARLQQAIAARRGSSGSQAAVERQRAELARTSAYARSLGCENRKFLIFGSDPPAQCGELNGQISRMQANLADLQARAGGGAGDLVARYNAECLHAQPSGPSNVFEALFGGIARLGAPPDQRRRRTPDSKTTAIEPRQSAPRARKGLSRRTPARTRYACGPATAASSPFPIRAPEAGRTAWRTFAGRCAPTPTWPSIRSRSAARSTRPPRRRASLTQICPTPVNSRRLTIRAAPAGARAKPGLKRSPTRKRGMATRSTTFW